VEKLIIETRSKLDKLKLQLDPISAYQQFESFYNYSTDMVTRILDIIDRVERSLHPFDRMANIWLSQISLDWLLVQHGFFKLSYYNFTSIEWRALQGLIKTVSEILEIRAPVLGAFYNTYGSTGTFILNRKIGRPFGQDYFMVMIDELDYPIFWPLVIHELSHCWLSSQNIIEEISSQIHSELEPKIVERRVEEALCDAVATSFMGPSYVYSYINRLWPTFSMRNSIEYPSDAFRLEMMIRILKQTNHDKVADIETMIEDNISIDWANEEIVASMILIEEFTKQLPFSSKPEDFVSNIDSVDEFVKNPPENLQNLFHTGWTLLNLSNIDVYSDDFKRINSVFLELLERSGTTVNS
jgi:hypothetical protein